MPVFVILAVSFDMFCTLLFPSTVFCVLLPFYCVCWHRERVLWPTGRFRDDLRIILFFYNVVLRISCVFFRNHAEWWHQISFCDILYFFQKSNVFTSVKNLGTLAPFCFSMKLQTSYVSAHLPILWCPKPYVFGHSCVSPFTKSYIFVHPWVS